MFGEKKIVLPGGIAQQPVPPEQRLQNLNLEFQRIKALGDQATKEEVSRLIIGLEGVLRELPKDHLQYSSIISMITSIRVMARDIETRLAVIKVAPETEQMLIDDGIFDRMVPNDKREIFLASTSPIERAEYLQLLLSIPETYRARFAERIATASKSRDEASIITALRGAMFEMSRLAKVIEQGLESVILDHPIPIIKLDFEGYDKKTTDFSEAPTKLVQDSTIDFDVPIVRDGKPYSYDTKSYPRKAFGMIDPASTRNQLLKYSVAVEKGLIAGATVEIRGRLSREMLLWAAGGSIDNPGAVPNVEIVYNHTLPSGKEYRFVLKRSKNNNGLRFKNEERYSDEDMRVVKGIQMSLADKSIMDLIADVPIDVNLASEALQPFLSHPETITTRELFEEFDKLRTEAVTKKLKEKTESGRVNKDNKANALSPEANEVYVEAMIRELQDYLVHNPKIAADKKHYVVAPKRMPEAVERVMRAVNSVANQERTRLNNPEAASRADERRKMGYLGRPEGVALDMEHFMVDALYAMNKPGFDATRVQKAAGKHVDLFFKKDGEYYRSKFNTPEEFDQAVIESKELQRALRSLTGGQRDDIRRLVKESTFVRSYDWPERFTEAANIPSLVEGQDRRYRELHIFDAKTGKTDRMSDTNDAKTVEAEHLLVKENIQRVRDFIQELRTSHPNRGEKMASQQKTKLNEHESNIKRLKVEQETETSVLKQEAKAVVDQVNLRSIALRQESKQLAKELNKPDISSARKLEIASRSDEIEEGIIKLNQEIDAAFAPMKIKSNEYLMKIREKEREIEKLYRKIVPEAEWLRFERKIVKRLDQNILKMIYTVKSDGQIIVQEEVLRGDVTGRAAHSELNGGLNSYGAGELAFEKQDGVWVLTEINNGSGHYRPDATSTLHYVKNLLESKGISTNQTVLVDSIMRGLELGRHLREESAF